MTRRSSNHRILGEAVSLREELCHIDAQGLLDCPVKPGNDNVRVSEAETAPTARRFHFRRNPVSKNIPITLACGDYEITRALKEGTVKPDGIDLTVLTDMDSTTRHWRFLRNRDFDMAETSASSYIVARGQDWPVRALPVFLHRRFRHGFVFINTGKGIRSRPT